MQSNEIIKRKRKEKGMTQTDLGKLLGVSKATVQKYESGEIVNLKSDTIKKLSEILEIDANVLIFGKYDNEIDTKKLKKQAILIDELNCLCDDETIILLEIFERLNPENQEKIIEYASMVEKVQDSTR